MNPQELLALSKKTAVTFHKFVLLSHGREKDLFCFFEGSDDCPYYSLRIKNIVKRNYHPIKCGNKQKVIDMFEYFKRTGKYQNYLKAFFVDKDFDSPLNNPLIYETPTYSVENLYTNEKTLIEILKNEFEINETDNEYNTIINLFRENQNDFHDKSLLFNSWYASLKEKRNLTGISTNVTLDEKIPENFISIKIGSITSDYDLIKIRATFPNALEITEEEVLQKQEEFRKANRGHIFRGKFEIHFLYHFLLFLIQDANTKKSILKKKTSFSINKTKMLSLLSSYAQTPECLERYLEGFKN